MRLFKHLRAGRAERAEGVPGHTHLSSARRCAETSCVSALHTAPLVALPNQDEISVACRSARAPVLSLFDWPDEEVDA